MDKNNVSLTPLEIKVLDALKQNAMDCSGGDFALAEEVDTRALGLSKQQFGALLTTLQTKQMIDVDITLVNGKTKVTQVTLR